MNLKSMSLVFLATTSITHSAYAGGFLGEALSNLGKAAGDVLSLGEAARQRNEEACKQSKAQELANLQGALNTSTVKIAALQEKSESIKREIQQRELDLERKKDDVKILTTMANSIEGFEAQGGALAKVIQLLKSEMELSKLDKHNLEAWNKTLTTLMPRIRNRDQSSAQTLLKQIEFATLTKNTEVITQVIQILENPPNSESLTQIKNVWVSFQSKFLGQINEIEGQKATLLNDLNSNEQTKAAEVDGFNKLQTHTNEVAARGC